MQFRDDTLENPFQLPLPVPIIVDDLNVVLCENRFFALLNAFSLNFIALYPLSDQNEKVLHCLTTPQPNRSKVFELQQSNQGYGESLGVKEAQKNAKQKYSIELFWRNLILKFAL